MSLDVVYSRIEALERTVAEQRRRLQVYRLWAVAFVIAVTGWLIAVTPVSRARLILTSGTKAQLTLRVDAAGVGAIGLSDKNGVNTATIVFDSEPIPTLRLFDGRGNVVWSTRVAIPLHSEGRTVESSRPGATQAAP